MNGNSIELTASEKFYPKQRPQVRVETEPSALHAAGVNIENSTRSSESGLRPSEGLKPKLQRIRENRKLVFQGNLRWIPENWTWSKIKPVIRCAAVAWVSAVLFIIPPVEIWLGQASFLILIASFLSPPSDPFIAVLERETLILLFVTVSWAWACLGMRLADLARKNRNSSVSILQAISGNYIEVAPTVILAIFIFFGSAFFLYIKARQGPGPYLFACVFACICIDITLTTAVLFPYPFYLIGRAIVIPLALHSALSLLGSILIFPSTISAQFTNRLQGVISPLIKLLDLHRSLLQTPIDSLSFASTASTIFSTVNQSEAGLIPLAASSRLLKSDLIYARFSPEDFRAFQKLGRRVVGRANGMGLYFTIIDPLREKFPVTPAPSQPGTPGASTPRYSSRRHSPERGLFDNHEDKDSLPSSPTHRRGLRDSPTHSHFSRSHGLHHRHHHHILHNSLLNLSMTRVHKQEHVVGVFESQRYMNLEATRLQDDEGEAHTARTILLLHECCDPLLESCKDGLVRLSSWLNGVRDGRFRFWVTREQKQMEWKERLAGIQVFRDKLASALESFRADDRHRVLEPYIPAFETSLNGDLESERHIPPHRHLFHCYVYQYHLIQFASIVVEMLDEVIRLEKERRVERLWTPVQKLFRWNKLEIAENVENDDDDDPDVIQGLKLPNNDVDDLGLPRRRDPDALPPRNALEWLMSHLYYGVSSLGGGNTLFAVKAGLLTVVLCLPSFFKSSAPFAYKNRFVWAIFMGQLTLARFRGDTAFGLTARILSTFLGGVVGMAMWYVSCGSGRGNPYGLAAVCAVCFPLFFYARLYWPGPPMTNIVFFVTAILVVGYSYQDINILLPGSPGFGFTVAWRRFVLVTVGVVAACIASFLPPSTTIRRYQRNLLSTTSSEIGAIYCSIISFANSRRDEEIQEIITSLIAIRSKIKRSVVLKTNVIYEFSLRGRWPAKRYQAIMDLQLQIGYLLSHLMSVVEHLEPAWTRAFLRRSRFLDSDFQGDMLAVITMISSSLRTGNPLPQITPCPLLDRFMLRYHGLDIIHKEAEEDYGLPRLLTLDTLQNEQYMMFCVGVSTAFGIVNRLDRLMLASKEIVGEQYHIHGVGFAIRKGVELGPRTSSVHFRPPRDV